MSKNDHIFTFISPYGVMVEIKGHSYATHHRSGVVEQYTVSNHNDANEVATIPGNWVFVRVAAQYKVRN